MCNLCLKLWFGKERLLVLWTPIGNSNAPCIKKNNLIIVKCNVIIFLHKPYYGHISKIESSHDLVPSYTTIDIQVSCFVVLSILGMLLLLLHGLLLLVVFLHHLWTQFHFPFKTELHMWADNFFKFHNFFVLFLKKRTTTSTLFILYSALWTSSSTL